MRLFKKREEEQELGLRDLEKLIADKISEESDEFVRNGKITLDNIRTIIDLVNAIIKEINALKMGKNEIASQYISAMNNAKRSLSLVIDNIDKSKLVLNSIEDLDNVKREIASILSKLGEVTKSHRRVIYELFPSHAKKLKTELEKLKEESEELYMLTSNYEEKVSILEDSKAKILEINEAEKELSKIKEDNKRVEGNILDLNKKLESINNELDNIKGDKEYLKQKELLNKITAEYQEILDDISRSLSNISRAINKYDYTLGIEKSRKELLASIINKPSNIIDIDVNILIALFNDIIKAIRDNKIQLKSPEKDISALEELKSKLSSYVSLAKEYEDKIREVRDATRASDIQLEHLEESLRDIKYDLEQLNKMREDYLNKIKELEALIKNNIDAINKELEKIMLKIRFKYY